jgi:predicted ABC-type exoprotein transport system permease subunit
MNRYTRLMLWAAFIALLVVALGRLAYQGGQWFGTN